MCSVGKCEHKTNTDVKSPPEETETETLHERSEEDYLKSPLDVSGVISISENDPTSSVPEEMEMETETLPERSEEDQMQCD